MTARDQLCSLMQDVGPKDLTDEEVEIMSAVLRNARERKNAKVIYLDLARRRPSMSR